MIQLLPNRVTTKMRRRRSSVNIFLGWRCKKFVISSMCVCKCRSPTTSFLIRCFFFSAVVRSRLAGFDSFDLKYGRRSHGQKSEHVSDLHSCRRKKNWLKFVSCLPSGEACPWSAHNNNITYIGRIPLNVGEVCTFKLYHFSFWHHLLMPWHFNLIVSPWDSTRQCIPIMVTQGLKTRFSFGWQMR